MVRDLIFDPACNILYSSFYVKGLFDVFGKNNCLWKSSLFEGLHYTKDTHVFAFVYKSEKYVIDFADSNEIFYLDFLEWADVYGKVNYKQECIPLGYKGKITPVGCNFAINYGRWNKYNAALYALINYLKCYKRISFGFTTYLSRYIILSKRKCDSIALAFSENGKLPYIFFQTRWWSGQSKVNNQRAMFIRVCKELDKKGIIVFEGGMVPDVGEYDKEYEDIIVQSMPYEEYVMKAEKSLLVFNAPAYFDCHGWKLPEYLSMGKIILSTPFVNSLPIEMKHERDIYYVNPSEKEMTNAILHIINNPDLQLHLKEGARSYWKRYACPKASMEFFINQKL